MTQGLLKGKAIILQSPAGGGKDTIAKALCEATGAAHKDFKDSLYTDVDDFFKLSKGTTRCLNEDRKEKESLQVDSYSLFTKDYVRLLQYLNQRAQLTQDIYALTVRQALIYVSELVMKPKHGNDYYGKKVADNFVPEGIVTSDGGFREECLALADKVGYDNTYIVQMTRKGCDFSGDSRGFIEVPEGIHLLKCTNDSTVESLVKDILHWVEGEKK